MLSRVRSVACHFCASQNGGSQKERPVHSIDRTTCLPGRDGLLPHLPASFMRLLGRRARRRRPAEKLIRSLILGKPGEDPTEPVESEPDQNRGGGNRDGP
jgi:hypothetical protein